MMGALRGYAHVDPSVAYHLWVLVFPIVWATLEKQQQINLAKPIIQLLSKEYHQRQAGQRPNVIQVWPLAWRWRWPGWAAWVCLIRSRQAKHSQHRS